MFCSEEREGESTKEEGRADGACAVPEEKIKLHRGERVLHDMQLETLQRSMSVCWADE